MNRKQEQAELFFELGLLLQPLVRIAEAPEAVLSNFSRARAEYAFAVKKFKQEVKRFSEGESLREYQAEYTQISNYLNNFGTQLTNHSNDLTALSTELQVIREQVRDSLLSVPVFIESEIQGAQTPFSCYCLINDLCRTVSKRFTLIDRYFDDGFGVFYRYIRNVPQNVKITLVTWPQEKYKAPYWKSLIDVSRLFANERGPGNYKLVANPNVHDRWLWCDNDLYQLGGSIKEAGMKTPFTITKIESTSVNFQAVEQLINTGTELFGPTQPDHPLVPA